MSEYGLKIKNYEAGSIYEYNLGVRTNYDYTDAMFTNSLFSDFLRTQERFNKGIWKEESTRDIICIEFNYGSRSYEQEIKHLEKLYKEEDNIDKRNKIKELINNANNNEDRFDKKSKDEIRTLFYVNGVDIEYITRKKNGEIKKKEIIHYKMLYRTPGKAKKGSCMFINEKLYNVAHNFLYMGIKLPEKNSPIIEMGAYSSLITSSIDGRIKIDPNEILVVKDIDSEYVTNVISVKTDENKQCIAEYEDNVTLKNTMFDGQALIDSSIFPDWGNGYILLRHHLCKMAAFNSNIQLFFKDYFGDKYETSIVKDMWGNEHYVKDIKLITTENAMKWVKFDNVTYEYWSEKVRENGCIFGIVKTAHESKLGNVQRMSYQMINSLDIDIMDNVNACTVEYINKLKQDNNVFLDYLRDNKNFSNDYEVLVALCEQDYDFTRSEYFRNRKKNIIQSYVLNFKNGHAIQNADNLVIVGSPYAMLLHSVGDDVEKDCTFNIEEGTIQCYTERFNFGEYLVGFRSPFNSKNNMGYLHNVDHEYFHKYFNFGKQIVAVNMIHTDFQDRNNGSDQDSDSIYTTNQIDIVNYAKKCYAEYPTIVNKIPMEKNLYNYCMEDFAKVDNNLAAAQMAIGESSNLAQICLTYTYNTTGDELEKYNKYVCILSVLAQVAIDNAKRKFDIDLNKEIRTIKSNMNINKKKYPLFWSVIRPGFNKIADDAQKELIKINKNPDYIPKDVENGFMDKEEYIEYLKDLYSSKNKISPKLKCPMNSIYNIKMQRFNSSESTLPMSYFFVKYEMDSNKRKSKKVEELIQKYSFKLYDNWQVNIDTDDEEDLYGDEYLVLRSDFDELIQDIRMTYLSRNYLGLFSWLINRAFCIGKGIKGKKDVSQSKIDNNKSLLLKVLYDVNPTALLQCFSKNIIK